jgi:hypothetical protein
MENTENECVAVLDHCLLDYFSGYHRPVLQIIVEPWETLTNREIAQLMETEKQVMYEYLEPDIRYFDAYIDALREKPDEIFFQGDEAEKPEPDELQEYYDSGDAVNMFFAVINPVTVHGITFLDR